MKRQDRMEYSRREKTEQQVKTSSKSAFCSHR